MPDFSRFKVLLDDPALKPALGFDDYATAFAQMIEHSEPRFAIGIFGDWGSGKTTLMQAIKREVAARPTIVPVWFNAWRYEREEHLIVPLLDTLRESLLTWGKEHPPAGSRRDIATIAARKVAGAARALAAGVSLRASIPFTNIEASFEPGQLVDSVRSKSAAQQSQSFYHASFNALNDAIEGFVGNGARRIVVFVDDLDRCLPANALQVLESMKLFFDLEGFVFVVGLDQTIIERAIETKYVDERPADVDGASPRAVVSRSPIDGAQYIKKIFQVPFGLPRIDKNDLEQYVNAVIEGGGLEIEQRADLAMTVMPHLRYISGQGTVNPREVKRLINAYTLQMKMLSAKLGYAPDADVVLALQIMAFRLDWQPLYELLTADPDLVVDTLHSIVNRGDESASASLSQPVPQSVVIYLRGPGIPLLTAQGLGPYITSAEATRSADPEALGAQQAATRLANVVEALTHETIPPDTDWRASINETLESIEALGRRRRSPAADDLNQRIKKLHEGLPTTGESPEQRAEWATSARDTVAAIVEDVRELRREATVGSSSAS